MLLHVGLKPMAIENGKIPNLSSKEQGTFRKYNVSRVDGKYPDANLFVLDLDNDKFARIAMQTYINCCQTEYPLLARDLQIMLDEKD